MMMALVVAQCPPDVANPGGHRPWVLFNFYFVSGALAICNLQGRRGSRASPPPVLWISFCLKLLCILHSISLHSTPLLPPSLSAPLTPLAACHSSIVRFAQVSNHCLIVAPFVGGTEGAIRFSSIGIT